MADEPPIIIKKIVSHGGHHGGAWKVAYADFVTAMMALFIVLWLLSTSSKHTQDVIGGYFRDPSGTATLKGTTKRGTIESVPLKKEDMAKLKKALIEAIQKIDDLKKLNKQIEITITEEGLRIELIEDKKGTFFEMGSPKPTPVLIELLKLLSAQLGLLPNKISVEGHTDSTPYSSAAAYGNWELSADRANMARRLMQSSGVGANQIAQVRGFADQSLRKPLEPTDASNRRVTLIVQYLEADRTPSTVAGAGGLPAGAGVRADGAAGVAAPEPGDAKPASPEPKAKAAEKPSAETKIKQP
jgi:chemotaxis protein MotB